MKTKIKFHPLSSSIQRQQKKKNRQKKAKVNHYRYGNVDYEEPKRNAEKYFWN